MKDHDVNKVLAPSPLERAGVRIKVCGMKHNTAEVAQLQPDYLGFIFYEKSPRNYDLGEIPELRSGIKKVGVFVNAEVGFILDKIQQFKLDVIQLHGEESPEYCEKLKRRHADLGSASHQQVEVPALSLSKCSRDQQEGTSPSPVKVPALSLSKCSRDPQEGTSSISIEVWKVFSIKEEFDFSILEKYEPYVNKFLFDTKGKEKGGNGYTFNWDVLKNYPSQKPFILSGGIGLEELDSVKELLLTELPLYAIDVNSKFEKEPGLKNTEDLKKLLGSFSNTERTE